MLTLKPYDGISNSISRHIRCDVNKSNINYNQLMREMKHISWAAIPGGRGDMSPNIFGEGTAMAVSHPIFFPLSYTSYGSLAFTCTSILYALEYTKNRTHIFHKFPRIHKIQDTILLAFPL